MEKQSKKRDDLTKKLVQEAGTYSPSADFVNNVMQSVQAISAKEKVYQPLISKKILWFIGLCAAVSFILVYLNPTSGIAFVNELDLTALSTVENPFANLKFSKTLLYGVGFLGLFLLQVPLLKKYVERSYQ